MAMAWFRMFVEARNDAKLNSLTDAQFRVWFRLLCYAAEQGDRGRIEGRDLDVLAVEVACGDVQLLGETLKRLETLHVLQCNVEGRFLAFHHFEKRQRGNVTVAVSSSTERVRKYRARKRLAATAGRVTQNETSVTLVKRSRAREDSDSDIKNPPPPLKVGNEEDERQELESWCRGILTQRGVDRGDAEDFYPKLSGWLAGGYAADWIRGAVQLAAMNARAGGLAQYANKLLLRWHRSGKPDYETAAEQRPNLEMPRTGSVDSGFYKRLEGGPRRRGGPDAT